MLRHALRIEPTTFSLRDVGSSLYAPGVALGELERRATALVQAWASD